MDRKDIPSSEYKPQIIPEKDIPRPHLPSYATPVHKVLKQSFEVDTQTEYHKKIELKKAKKIPGWKKPKCPPPVIDINPSNFSAIKQLNSVDDLPDPSAETRQFIYIVPIETERGTMYISFVTVLDEDGTYSWTNLTEDVASYLRADSTKVAGISFTWDEELEAYVITSDQLIEALNLKSFAFVDTGAVLDTNDNVQNLVTGSDVEYESSDLLQLRGSLHFKLTEGIIKPLV